MRNDLVAENIRCDTNGRVIVFDILGITFGNFYLPSGTDAISKNNRKNYFGEIIPNMLINCKTTGFVGGDLNCIIRSQDATNNPNSKMSSCLSRLTKSFLWTDSFLAINPHMQAYSRFYDIKGVVGASRIDRQYHRGLLRCSMLNTNLSLFLTISL